MSAHYAWVNVSLISGFCECAALKLKDNANDRRCRNINDRVLLKLDQQEVHQCAERDQLEPEQVEYLAALLEQRDVQHSDLRDAETVANQWKEAGIAED